MDPKERDATPSHWQGEDDMKDPDGQTGPPEAKSQSSVTQDQRMKTNGQDHQKSQQDALELEFQDSNLSPALSLLPLTAGLEHSVTEYSYFLQGVPKFAPLRAFPDVSMVSERFHLPVYDSSTHSCEESSLSQHPLTQATVLSEDGANGNFYPSQRNAEENLPREGSEETESKLLADLTHPNKGEFQEDETFFLNKDVPAQQLLDLLQREVGMQSKGSREVSSESQTSMKSTGLCPDPAHKTIGFERQGPPGEASPSQKQSRKVEISNITVGSRGTQPDDGSEELHRELLSEVRRLSGSEASKKLQGLTPTHQLITHSHRLMRWMDAHGKPSGHPCSVGSEHVHRDQELWSSQNQPGSDGSYIGFLPKSQSTPGIFFDVSKFNIKAKLAHLSAIEFNKALESYQSISGTQSADGRHADDDCAEDPQRASEKVHSLPSLNYLQKVDAWRTRQSLERSRLLGGPTPHKLSGVPPKNNGDDAGANAQDASQISSSAPSGGSSPRRGEAVGGAPGDVESKGPTASPFGRSQSLSSLSTVVVSADKHQQSDADPQTETAQSQADTHPLPGAAIKPSPLHSLGHFSDVSVDPELSSSQDSYTEIKVGPSVGTSSVVSLDLDHYAPYWTYKHPTTSSPPPGQKELNIDERIPLYLQNLGIDQTPSKILTPFAPRGPIREPEFSPTDLCTIKGSSGTPTKSTQPSEGSSPHKGEFSRSSVLSVDSSISIPLSLDSLGPAALVSEQGRARTLPSDIEIPQQENRAGWRSQPEHAGNVTATKRNVALQSSHPMDPDGEDSFLSTRALSEILKLLSQADDVVSSGSSTASSEPHAPYHVSDKDIVRPPKTEAGRLQSSSLPSSSSTGVDLKSHSSLPWARSSSDSVLVSEKPQQGSAGGGNLTSSWQPGDPSTLGPHDGIASNRAGTSRRAEPEGCSAAPPDKIQTQPPGATSTQQLNLTSADRAGLPEEEEKATPTGPGAESPSSSPLVEDADQEPMSDGSSESSLAVRVAKLLQNESPATMASSTPSVTDQEEGKARELIKSKVSRQQRELLLLDVEDRRHIEEIKKDLLLTNPLKSRGSTDTESSAASSVGVNKEISPTKATDTFSSLTDAAKQLGTSLNHPQPHTDLPSTLHVDLEARVCEIAAREGITLPPKRPQVFTSTSKHPHRLSVTSSPSTSPPPPLSPASRPLHLAELSVGTTKGPAKTLDEAERAALAQITGESPSGYDEGNQDAASFSGQGNQRREDAVGGRSEEHSPPTQVADKQDVFRTVRLFLPPKTSDHTSTSSVLLAVPRKASAALRDSSPAACSPDEGAGSTSPAEWDARPPPDASLKAVSRHTDGIRPSSKRHFTAETPVPVLLPYKPCGSEELFYVPQTEADVSSTDQYGSTMESSHTGSDDAVPPSFSSEVLGDQDPGLDRGVSIRHKEGIYSKRRTAASFRMEDGAHKDASLAADIGTPAVTPKPSQVSATVTRMSSTKRDRATSPIHFLSHTQQSRSGLDQLWLRFCDQWTPHSPDQASLLERLERLSRVLRRSQAAHASGGQRHDLHEQPGRTERTEVRRREHGVATCTGWKEGGGRQAEHPAQLGPRRPPEHDSRISSQYVQFSPADRDDPDTMSTISGSVSTVDTARLVRAFGADRVKQLKNVSSLGKLYDTINKQRERGSRTKDDSSVTVTPTGTTGTEESVVSESASTSSSRTVSPPRGPSSALTAKRAGRAIDKSIQTGDLEIVSNASRRHTRDVGTTFPSPGEAGAFREISPSSSSTVGGMGGEWRLPPKSNNSRRQKRNKSSSLKPYPKGVSWFVSADEPRKENRPEQSSAWRPNTAWFEPCSRARPWRQPLRQRQVQEDGSSQSDFKTQPEPDPNAKARTLSCALPRVSLQAALEMRRPEFISRSQQRVRCLALLAEQRRIHGAFSRERNLLFQHKWLPKTAGAALSRRAVPRKEMIQRSKQIYENLPEVRRRREEERRRAEYKSYRLNAQLYNKRIRNRVLGRKTAWH